MNLGTGNRRQTILAAVLGVAGLGACFFIYEQVAGAFGWNAPSAAPAATAPAATSESAAVTEPAAAASPAEGKDAKVVRTSAAALDPTLHMEAMRVSEEVVYAGSGRNIFSPNSAPPPVTIPKAVASARSKAEPALPPRPVGPPPPPPIDLKFFGFETTGNGRREAFLLHDDNVYLASAGDVVMRRYRVISIDARSILVEDMQNSNRQTLPLLAN